jgi:hypothetical protein
VRMIERLRRIGLQVDVRALFATPTLMELAAAIGTETDLVEVPPNLIPQVQKQQRHSLQEALRV